MKRKPSHNSIVTPMQKFMKAMAVAGKRRKSRQARHKAEKALHQNWWRRQKKKYKAEAQQTTEE